MFTAEGTLSPHPLRFVLLQARNLGDSARADEHAAFATRLGVPQDQITQVDILRDPLGLHILEGADALLVGGAGEHSVVDPGPVIRSFIDFLAAVADLGFPTFASCFGFQALVVGLGGVVEHDEPHAEVGTYQLTLTREGQQDPLFSALPLQFNAQLGHKDRATSLPSCVSHLARSPRAEFQAIRVRGKPVYATQFHPELTWLENRGRFERYMDVYGRLFGAEAAQERLRSHAPSPEANALLARFVAQCLPSATERS